MSRLTESPAWRALTAHRDELAASALHELYDSDGGRRERLVLRCGGLLLDGTRHPSTARTVALLADLARERDVEGWRGRMFRGEPINHTESQPALHTALRAAADEPLLVDGIDVTAEVRRELRRMRVFVERLRDGHWSGYDGREISDVVNIGIGGSDLGPRMVTEALAALADGPRVHFAANVDPAELDAILSRCDPPTTLFIVASKSFTTRETMDNAARARRWLLAGGGSEDDVGRHFVAVSANADGVRRFGIDDSGRFSMWDWVGGRYSVWSAIGLPIAVACGMDVFERLLAGARVMDEHFLGEPLDANMPVMMALIGVWHVNFLGASSLAVVPYAERLRLLPAWLQQLDMESNGKSVDRDGSAVDHATGPVLWGGTGSNAQHAFFQLLHQGSHRIPVDFILVREPMGADAAAHRVLLANAVAQMEALMRGKTSRQVRAELEGLGMTQPEIEFHAPYRTFEGGRPSSAIVLDRLDPECLGALLALYEHKVFVQGVIWNLDSFDQWGVEYGKQLAPGIERRLASRGPESDPLLRWLRGDG
jgi:glucose-6-phosphate isomerase